MKTRIFLLVSVALAGCAQVKITSATTPEWEAAKSQKAKTVFKVQEVQMRRVRSMTSTSAFENPGTGLIPAYSTDKYLCQVEARATVLPEGGDKPYWVGSVFFEAACHESLKCRTLSALAERAVEDGVITSTSESLCQTETTPPVAAASSSKN